MRSVVYYTKETIYLLTICACHLREMSGVKCPPRRAILNRQEWKGIYEKVGELNGTKTVVTNIR
jgi:hypothetical protein